MEGEYSQEWAELRRLRQRVLTIVLVGAAVFVLVPLITTYASHSAAKVIGLPLFSAWWCCCSGFSSSLASMFIGHASDAVSLSTTTHVGTQMEQSVRSALRSLRLAKMGGLRS